MGRIQYGFKRLVAAFSRSRNGNVAMMTAVALPILLMVSAGAIDLHNMARVKGELQDALDAASLAAARSPYSRQADIQRVGMDSIRANMPQYFRTNPGDVATFTLTGKDQVSGTATVQVKTIVANIFFPPYGKLFDDYMPVVVSSDVMRASRNVEVALALDLTASMEGSRLTDLKVAAKELIAIAVQEDQSIYTTRVALVPYAAGVNAGAFSEALRGRLQGPVNINDASHGQGSTVTGSSSSYNSRQVTITRSGHGLQTGDVIVIKNGNNYEVKDVTRTSATQFRVARSSNLSSGFTYRTCEFENCSIKVTLNNHGLTNNERVRISGVQGMTALNGDFNVKRINNNEFLVDGTDGFNSNRTRGGSLQCGSDGCEIRLFVNRNNGYSELPSSTCVSERPRGNNAPSEAAPSSTNWLGRSYLENSNACLPALLTPLSSQLKGAGNLNALVDGYRAQGSTGGQVGIELAWYALSPDFSKVFPTSSHANPYNNLETVKAAVLMTDGDFNTPFCQGVIANTATSGSGNANAQINCAATNGDPFSQSLEICDGMKKKGIVVYTVAFGLSGGSAATNVMRKCASSPDNFHDASSGTDLKEAFKSIGRDITRLRIAR